MSLRLSQFNRHNPLRPAWLFSLVVLVMLPALLFSRFMPAWAPLVALVGLAVIFVLRGLAAAGRPGRSPIVWAVLLLSLSLAVNLRFTLDRQVSLPLTYAFVANLALFWAVAALRDTPWLRYSGWAVLLAGLGLGLLILLGTRFNTNKLAFVDPTLYTTLPERRQAFWDQESFNANIGGGLLALFWAPAVVLAWQGRSWQQRDAAKVVAVALLVMLVLTQSRGALLAALVGLLAVTSLRSHRWRLFWVVVLVLVGLATTQLGPTTMLEAVFTQSDLSADSSWQARQELWQRAAYLLRDFPLTGVGLGLVGPAIQQFYPTQIIDPQGQINHAHNIFLQVGAELGLAGLLAHVTLYLTLFYLLLKRVLTRPAGSQRALALGLWGSLIVLLTHGLVDAIIASPQVALVVWGLLGLMAAVATDLPRDDGTDQR